MVWVMGGVLTMGFFALLYLRSGGLFVRYEYIEEGRLFRPSARSFLEKNRRKGVSKWVWIFIGGGLGLAVVAAIVYTLS